MSDNNNILIEIWDKYSYWLNMEGWNRIDFDGLEPGMIVRFNHNDNYIYRVISYPFLSSKYSFNNEPVMTIINSEFLCWPENN